MIDPEFATEEVTDAVEECCASFDERICENPGASLAVAIGAGLLLAAIFRLLRPEPKPRQRALELLEELQDRLSAAGKPMARKAAKYATRSANGLKHDTHRGEAHLEHLVHNAARRLRGLWS